MKVALVHWRLLNMGGLESRLRMYIDYFHRRGDDLTVYCYKQSPDFLIPEGVSVVKIELGLMPKQFRLWYFNHLLSKKFKASDFDFSLTLGRTTQQEACLAPGDHLGFMRAGNRRWRKLKDHMQILLDKKSFEKSRIIFPCSDFIHSNLITLYGIDPKKLVTLYPPLNTLKFNSSYKKDKTALRNKFNMNPDKKTFVVVSTAHKRKGIPLLLEIFKRAEHLQIELKIAGSPKLNSNLPNIEFIGYVGNVEELYAAADFSIHPALYEPFGQVISESLACGTPVIISEFTGWSTNLPPSYGRVVNGFDPEIWLNAITNALDTEFEIDSDFAEKYQLSVENHMEKMITAYFAR